MPVPVVQSGNRLCKACFTIWVSGDIDRRKYRCSMLAIGMHVLHGQNRTENGVWKNKTEKHGVMSLYSDYLTPTEDENMALGSGSHASCMSGWICTNGGSIIVWGVLSWHCLGSFVRELTSLNVIRCVELLDYHLFLFMMFCYPHVNVVFLQDNGTSQVPVGHWLVIWAFPLTFIS
ncbi:hypothetical protein TNCV_4894881 [Trichonephila clavipes]|nr:hypothetical protein TNCV_4894881 [Trichonephila clavipes]